MILIPLIVVPCTIVGFGAVFLLDRMGVMPQGDGMGMARTAHQRTAGSRRLALAAMVVMGAWLLAWIVLLIVGLGVVWV